VARADFDQNPIQIGRIWNEQYHQKGGIATLDALSRGSKQALIKKCWEKNSFLRFLHNLLVTHCLFAGKNSVFFWHVAARAAGRPEEFQDFLPNRSEIQIFSKKWKKVKKNHFFGRFPEMKKTHFFPKNPAARTFFQNRAKIGPKNGPIFSVFFARPKKRISSSYHFFSLP